MLRNARNLGLLLLVCLSVARGQQKINPATQINWPANCQVYNVEQAACPPVGVITFRGAWSNATPYNLNDAVYFNGSTYVSIQAGNTNHEPDTSPTWWTLLVSGTSSYFPGSPTVTFSGAPTTTNNIPLATSPSAAGWFSREYLQLRTTLVPISGTINYGDSTMACWGASWGGACFGAQLQNDVPGSWLADNAVAGTSTADVSVRAWATYNPLYGSSPLITYEGGINDANNPGATTGGLHNATLATLGGVSHLAIPFANQTMSSSASSSTGTWSTSTFGGLAAGVPGTFMSSSTNGSTRTYNLGPGANFIYAWGAADSSAGTFTVTWNGSPLPNFCTGTTTWDSFGCNGQTIGYGGLAVFATTLSGNTSGSNTLVITVTSATSDSNVVYDGAVMLVPTNPQGMALAGTAPIVGVQGVIQQQGDANSAATAAYDGAVKLAFNVLRSASVSNVYLADVRSGVPAGATYPGAVPFSYATGYGGSPNCPGGAGSLHPADCGYRQIEQVHINAAAAAGMPVFVENMGARQRNVPTGMYHYGQPPDGSYNLDDHLNPNSNISTTQPMFGWCWFDQSGACQAREAFEVNNYFNLEGNPFGHGIGGNGYPTTGLGCNFPNPTNSGGGHCAEVWLGDSFGSFAFTPKHLGAGAPNGNLLQPATSSTPAYSMDSQQSGTGALINATATLVFMESGTTSVQLRNCAPHTGIYGANWTQEYINDTGSTISSLTFSITGGSGDTINGGSTYTVSGIAAHGEVRLTCSQGTSTTATITAQLLNPTSSGGSTPGTYWQVTGYTTGGTATLANTVQCEWFAVPPGGLSVGHVNLDLAGSNDTGDIGFYNAAGTLVAHTGAGTLTAAGQSSLAFTGGTQTIPAGGAYFCATTTGGALDLVGNMANWPSLYGWQSTGISSSGGALPSTITPPSAPDTTGGHQGMAFLLTP